MLYILLLLITHENTVVCIADIQIMFPNYSSYFIFRNLKYQKELCLVRVDPNRYLNTKNSGLDKDKILKTDIRLVLVATVKFTSILIFVSLPFFLCLRLNKFSQEMKIYNLSIAKNQIILLL